MNDDVRAYLDAVTPAKRRRDAETLVALMTQVTSEPARLWGTIIGFGDYHYRYESGREGDGPAASFAPRKAASTVYLPEGVGAHAEALARLGPHSTGMGCLYLPDLEKIDLDLLRSIVTRSYQTVTAGIFSNRAQDSASGNAPAGAG